MSYGMEGQSWPGTLWEFFPRFARSHARQWLGDSDMRQYRFMSFLTSLLNRKLTENLVIIALDV